MHCLSGEHNSGCGAEDSDEVELTSDEVEVISSHNAVSVIVGVWTRPMAPPAFGSIPHLHQRWTGAVQASKTMQFVVTGFVDGS